MTEKVLYQIEHGLPDDERAGRIVEYGQHGLLVVEVEDRDGDFYPAVNPERYLVAEILRLSAALAEAEDRAKRALVEGMEAAQQEVGLLVKSWREEYGDQAASYCCYRELVDAEGVIEDLIADAEREVEGGVR